MHTLLIIDPQNDFCDPRGSLFVPGAAGDMERLAGFIRATRRQLGEVIVTLDSHPSVAIERPTFWRRGDGGPVAAFTQITHAQLAAGEYSPIEPSLRSRVLTYLQALEAQGRYKLMVWPVHCVIGAWGHNIPSAVLEAVGEWESQVQRGAFKVLKGQNPLTEQYSAVRAEVPSADDPRTQTNRELIEQCRPGSGLLLVAGEAASHCVAATLEHLFEAFSDEEIRRVILLSDCMSPVAGFEAEARGFIDGAVARGARAMTSTQALTEISTN
ncbi:cysteine hydrolase family protein [Peristeroidobacter soli]|uniref:isochorismatase family protein n=1 Tax=Peristeroidobacter soli TaxID=2497877 RepID=UPI00101D2B2C|nr:isochorismatase family protein [Peristeroidobacter soli]